MTYIIATVTDETPATLGHGDCSTKPRHWAWYEAITQDGYVGWLCRPCRLVHIEARMGDDGPTWKGVRVADLVESATEHEQEAHADALSAAPSSTSESAAA